MNEIGLFEAKTKFSEICERVASGGQPVLITRRGEALVRIEPAKSANHRRKSVWDRRAAYEKKHGRITEAFNLPARGKQTWRNPFDE